MTDGGYTPAEIRAMTLADVDRLYAHWGDFPPLRDLVAAYLGFKPKARADYGDVADLLSMFPDGTIK